mgnify:CR=1
RRLDTRRARQLVITSLATLGTVLLFGLANHGPVVIDAISSCEHPRPLIECYHVLASRVRTPIFRRMSNHL